MAGPRAPYAAQADGAATTLDPRDDVLLVGDRAIDWLDVDGAATTDAPVRLALRLADGSTLSLSHLGARGDAFAEELREKRGRARRAALTQSTAEPLASFEARQPDGSVLDVHLFAHALTVEPRADAPVTHVPLPLIRSVTRDGWVLSLACRGIDDVALRGFGARTDEVEARLAEARTALGAATRAALTAFDPALAGLDLPDGWAVPAPEAGSHAAALEARWMAGARGAEAAALRTLVGDAGLRYGMWTEGGTTALPFVLAAAGSGAAARVAVEAVDADDRATFVFATDDVDRLGAALVLSAFRREVLSLPDDALGRWAVAVRTQPAVRWARERLVARVVHDAGWTTAVTAALRPS